MKGLFIPASFNETQLDELAHLTTFSLRACPAFGIEFQCVKLFPHCINISASAYVIGMCTQSCLAAKQDKEGFCQALDIDDICSDPTYFSPGPDCTAYTMEINQSVSTWNTILAVVLGSCGFIMLLSLLVGYLRTKFYKPQDDPHDFEDERIEAERMAKLKEKSGKQGGQYSNLDDSMEFVCQDGSPTTRRWTSAQEAREAALARERARQSSQASFRMEQELVEMPQPDTGDKPIIGAQQDSEDE